MPNYKVNQKGMPAFSGGEVNNTQRNLLADNKAWRCRNARIEGFSTEIRGGMEEVLTLTDDDLPLEYNVIEYDGVSGNETALHAINNGRIIEMDKDFNTTYTSKKYYYYGDQTSGEYSGIQNALTTGGTRWNLITNGAIKVDGVDITGIDFSSITTNDATGAQLWLDIFITALKTRDITFEGYLFGGSGGSFYLNLALALESDTLHTFAAPSTGTDIFSYINFFATNTVNIPSYTNTIQKIPQTFTSSLRYPETLLPSSIFTSFAVQPGYFNTQSGSISSYKTAGASNLLPFIPKITTTTRSTPGNYSKGVYFDGCGWWMRKGSNQVRKSSNVSPLYTTGTGIDTFNFPSPVTGVVATDAVLYILTSQNVYAIGAGDIATTTNGVTYNVRQVQAEEGCIHFMACAGTANLVMYLTPSLHIAQIGRGRNIQGYEAIDRSDADNNGVQAFSENVSLIQTAPYCFFNPHNNLIKFYLSSSGTANNDICVAYNTLKDAFCLDDGCEFSYSYLINGIEYANIYNKRTLCELGKATNDYGDIIPFEWESKNFDLGGANLKKEFTGVRLQVKINNNPDVDFETYVDGVLFNTRNINSTDFGAPLSFGEYDSVTGEVLHDKTIVITTGNLRRKGRFIHFRIVNRGLLSRIQLVNLEFDYTVLPPLENQR